MKDIKMYLNWERLRLFYIVVSHKSLTKAAAALGKSPSTLSALIRTFEHELGMKVFNRQDGNLRLTKEGERLYALSQKMYHMTKAEEEVLSKNLTYRGGHIKVIAPAGLSTRYIGQFIDSFLIAHPEIQLEFFASNNLSAQDVFDCDILIAPKIAGLKHYTQDHLIDLDLRLYASKAYIEQFGEPKSLDDLDKHRLISFVEGRKYPMHLNWHLTAGLTGNKKRTPFLEVDESFGRCRLCAKGAGIISVPKQHPEVAIYDLVEILPHIAGPTTSYYLIIDERLLGYEKIQLFSRFLKDSFKAIQDSVKA